MSFIVAVERNIQTELRSREEAGSVVGICSASAAGLLIYGLNELKGGGGRGRMFGAVDSAGG